LGHGLILAIIAIGFSQVTIPVFGQELAGFVDPYKEPESYQDRYYSEPNYKEWFDKNYPNMTIEEAVGLIEPYSKTKED